MLTAFLAGVAMVVLLGFETLAAASLALGSPGLDVVAWMNANYYPRAGGFVLCFNFLIQTYVFWICMTVGLRLSLGPGLLLFMISVGVVVAKPPEFLNDYYTIWVERDCPESFRAFLRNTPNSHWLAGALVVYNIWLEEKLSRDRLGTLLHVLVFPFPRQSVPPSLPPSRPPSRRPSPSLSLSPSFSLSLPPARAPLRR